MGYAQSSNMLLGQEKINPDQLEVFIIYYIFLLLCRGLCVIFEGPGSVGESQHPGSFLQGCVSPQWECYAASDPVALSAASGRDNIEIFVHQPHSFQKQHVIFSWLYPKSHQKETNPKLLA